MSIAQCSTLPQSPHKYNSSAQHIQSWQSEKFAYSETTNQVQNWALLCESNWYKSPETGEEEQRHMWINFLWSHRGRSSLFWYSVLLAALQRCSCWLPPQMSKNGSYNTILPCYTNAINSRSSPSSLFADRSALVQPQKPHLCIWTTHCNQRAALCCCSRGWGAAADSSTSQPDTGSWETTCLWRPWYSISHSFISLCHSSPLPAKALHGLCMHQSEVLLLTPLSQAPLALSWCSTAALWWATLPRGEKQKYSQVWGEETTPRWCAALHFFSTLHRPWQVGFQIQRINNVRYSRTRWCLDCQNDSRLPLG